MELALVPKSRSSRLLFDYGTALYNANSTTLQPPAVASTWFNAASTATGNYPHLLNFFDAGNQGLAANTPGYAPLNLYRIFEYLQVPSKFVGTETVLNPTSGLAPTNGTGGSTLSDDIPATYLAGANDYLDLPAAAVQQNLGIPRSGPDQHQHRDGPRRVSGFDGAVQWGGHYTDSHGHHQ